MCFITQNYCNGHNNVNYDGQYIKSCKRDKFNTLHTWYETSISYTYFAMHCHHIELKCYFPPVCYKCAGDEQFAEFKEEVEQRAAAAAVNQDQNESEATNERSVASDVMQVLQQIDEAEKKQEERQKNDVDEIPDVSDLLLLVIFEGDFATLDKYKYTLNMCRDNR